MILFFNFRPNFTFPNFQSSVADASAQAQAFDVNNPFGKFGSSGKTYTQLFIIHINFLSSSLYLSVFPFRILRNFFQPLYFFLHISDHGLDFSPFYRCTHRYYRISFFHILSKRSICVFIFLQRPVPKASLQLSALMVFQQLLPLSPGPNSIGYPMGKLQISHLESLRVILVRFKL